MPGKRLARRARRAFVNAGCGPTGNARLPAFFRTWRQIRVDIDPKMKPDLVTSIADLSAIPSGTVDAVWSAHSLEHLYAHEVPVTLSEFRRVLRSTGFACIVIPDLQAIAGWIASDRLLETIYESAAGPVTAHDMIWGFGRAIAAGNTAMAHRCGFTPTPFIQRLTEAGFGEVQLRRKNSLELVALALCKRSKREGYRDAILAKLGF
jgi:SAM-dependent methyltransferase